MKTTKIVAIAFIGLWSVFTAKAQNNVGIGTITPDASAVLEMKSTSQGVLVPRMTQVQRNAIKSDGGVALSSTEAGLLIYQTDNTPGFYYWTGTGWLLLPATVAGANYGEYLFWDGTNWAVGSTKIGLGKEAGLTNQGTNGVAIGNQAGKNAQGANAIALGYLAGISNQGTNSVAIGAQTGNITQGNNAVAVGNAAGYNTQGLQAVAVGVSAGNTYQAANAIAVGTNAGKTSQAANAVAVGNEAGNITQGANAVAIGFGAGYSAQATNTIAIGVNAGNINQGNNAIAIGSNAGKTNQATNSVVINASGALLDAPASGLYITPVRNDNSRNPALAYNTTTKEVVYHTEKRTPVNFNKTQPNGDGFESSANQWRASASFIYQGSTIEGTPTSAKAIAYTTNLNTYYRFRLFDATNNVVLATSAALNTGSVFIPTIVDFGSISNLPVGEAVFEIQILATNSSGNTGGIGVQAVGMHTFQLFY